MTGVNSVIGSKQSPKCSVLQLLVIFLFPFFGIEELEGSTTKRVY